MGHGRRNRHDVAWAHRDGVQEMRHVGDLRGARAAAVVHCRDTLCAAIPFPLLHGCFRCLGRRQQAVREALAERLPPLLVDAQQHAPAIGPQGVVHRIHRVDLPLHVVQLDVEIALVWMQRLQEHDVALAAMLAQERGEGNDALADAHPALAPRLDAAVPDLAPPRLLDDDRLQCGGGWLHVRRRTGGRIEAPLYWIGGSALRGAKPHGARIC